MSKISEILEKLTDDIIFVLKKDLKTENNIFKAGTRVAFEKKYRTMYHDCYNVYSADKSDYMYIHRTQELVNLFCNVLEIDVERTNQYKSFLSETHINVSAIIIITLYVTGFVALSVFLWKADTSMNFIETLCLTFMLFFVSAVSCLTDIGLSIVKMHKKTEIELKYKRSELLQN